MDNFGFSSKVTTASAFFTVALLLGHCSSNDQKKPGANSKDACAAISNTATATSIATSVLTNTATNTATFTDTSTDTSVSLALDEFSLSTPSFSEITSLLNRIYKRCKDHRPKPSKAKEIDCSDYSTVSSTFNDILDDIRPRPSGSDLDTLNAWADAGKPNESGTTSTYTTTSTSTSTSGSTANPFINTGGASGLPNCP